MSGGYGIEEELSTGGLKKNKNKNFDLELDLVNTSISCNIQN